MIASEFRNPAHTIPPQRPRVGTLVHYHTADFPHSVRTHPLAAIITGYQNDGSANLAVFTHSGVALNHIYIKEGTEYGCWSRLQTEDE